MNEQTIKEMRQKLANFRMDPPTVSWDALETALDRGVRQNQARTWKRMGIAAAVALMLAGATWWALADKDIAVTGKDPEKPVATTGAPSGITQRATTTDRPATQSQPDTAFTVSMSVPTSSSTLPQNPAAPFLAEETQSERHLVEPETAQAKTVRSQVKRTGDTLSQETQTEEMANNATATSPTATDSVSTTPAPATNIMAKAPRETDALQQAQQRPSLRPSRPLPYPTAPMSESSIRPAATPRLSAKAFVMGNGVASTTSLLGNYLDASNSTPSDVPLTDNGDNIGNQEGNDNGEGSQQGKSPRKTKTKQTKDGLVRHHQPLRFGLTLNYSLGDRWSLETGIAYTRQKSDITDGNSSNSSWRQTNQQLNYIGIPVNLSYSIWKNRWLNIYASAGVMMEKMVKGEQTIRQMKYNECQSARSEDVHISPLQFSLNAAVGADFRLNRTVSLYAEPGFSYHFENNASVSTLYNDYPLGANLTFGLRINIAK